MADSFLLFAEAMEVTGQQAVWLQKAWDAAGVMHGADPKFVDMVEELFDVSQVTVCDLRIQPREPGEKVKAYFTCDEQCDLEGVALLLQRFMQTFEIKTSFSISYAETCSKMHTGQFGGGVVVVTAEKYVILGSDKLLELAEDEVKRGL